MKLIRLSWIRFERNKSRRERNGGRDARRVRKPDLLLRLRVPSVTGRGPKSPHEAETWRKGKDVAKRKVTIEVRQLPAGRVPRQSGRVRVSRAVGYVGGATRSFAPDALKELERVMVTNGRKQDLEQELRRRKREEKTELELRPWKVKTLAAQATVRLREQKMQERLRELEQTRAVEQAKERASREADALASLRWRTAQRREATA